MSAPGKAVRPGWGWKICSCNKLPGGGAAAAQASHVGKGELRPPVCFLVPLLKLLDVAKFLSTVAM